MNSSQIAQQLGFASHAGGLGHSKHVWSSPLLKYVQVSQSHRCCVTLSQASPHWHHWVWERSVLSLHIQAPSRSYQHAGKSHPPRVLRDTWPPWNMEKQPFAHCPWEKKKIKIHLCASMALQEAFNKNWLPRKILELPQFPTLITGRQRQGNSPGTTKLWLMQMLMVANPKCSQYTLKTHQDCTRWKDNVWSFLWYNISSHLGKRKGK